MHGKNSLLSISISLLLAACSSSPSSTPTGDAGHDAAQDSTAATFCFMREQYICIRDYAAMRIDNPTYDTCQSTIMMRCATFAFPAGCSPTQTALMACTNALADNSRVDTPTDMITECSNATLCGP